MVFLISPKSGEKTLVDFGNANATTVVLTCAVRIRRADGGDDATTPEISDRHCHMRQLRQRVRLQFDDCRVRLIHIYEYRVCAVRTTDSPSPENQISDLRHPCMCSSKHSRLLLGSSNNCGEAVLRARHASSLLLLNRAMRLFRLLCHDQELTLRVNYRTGCHEALAQNSCPRSSSVEFMA